MDDMENGVSEQADWLSVLIEQCPAEPSYVNVRTVPPPSKHQTTLVIWVLVTPVSLCITGVATVR